MRRGRAAALVALALVLATTASAADRLVTRTVSRGPLTASATYLPAVAPFGDYPPARLRITFHGRVVVDGDPPHCAYCAVWPTGAEPLRIRDLDGDGRPEVLLWTYWGGAHCCYDLYLYRQVGAWYVGQQMNFWDVPPRVRDLDRDGRPEFISFDNRFRYLFTSFAGSVMPIRIWTYRHGRFVNVTQRHPRLIRADAESSWRLVQQIRRAKDGREIQGAIAAWAADKYLLGEVADVWARLQPLSDAGVLKGGYGPPSGDAFLRALKRKLQDFGYGSAAAKA